MADMTTKVTLVANVTPYVRDVTRAGAATDKLGKDIDQTGNKASSFGKKMSESKAALVGLAAAGTAMAGTALVKFLTDSVNAAGNLQQSIGGVDSVFGDMAGTVHDFGKTSAEAVGLSRNEFNELITVTGALMKNKGLEDFTGKSLNLVQVGADLAATFGGTTKQAVEALNAAMRGESDPIERYGISLNMAAVNAELASKGLTGLKGAALEQAQAQARIDIITRQSADAMGQFAREADTLQGQQQRLNAKWEDAKAALGTALLPALTEVVTAMSAGVDMAVAAGEAFGKIPGPVKAAAAALAAVHLLGGPLRSMGTVVGGAMSSLGEAIGYARQSAERAGGGFTGLRAGLDTFTGGVKPATAAMSGLKSAGNGVITMLGGPWGAAFTAGAAVIGLWIDAKRKAKQRTDEYLASLDAETGAITQNTKELQYNELQRSGVLDKYLAMGGQAEDLIGAINGEAEAQERVNGVLDAKLAKMIESGHATDEYGTSVDVVRQKVGGMREELDRTISSQAAMDAATGAAKDRVLEQSKAAEDAGVALGFYEGAVDEVTDATEDAVDETLELAKAMGQIIDIAFSAIEADMAYEKALDDLTASIKENGAEHDRSTEKGRANMDALLDVAKAARDNAEAQLANGESLESVQRSMDLARGALVRGAQQMGMTKSEANALADQLGLTDRAVEALDTEIRHLDGKNVKVTATGMAESQRGVLDLGWQIGRLQNKTVTITTRYVTIGDPRNAGGGSRLYNSAFAEGGYTGAGAKYEPAGVVHKDEFVHTKREMSQPGRKDFHTDLWRGLSVDEAYYRHKLRGYADGGPVAPWSGSGRWGSPAPVYSLPVQGRVSDAPAALSGPLDLSDSSARLVARYIGTEFRGSQREAVDRAIRVDRGRGTSRLPVMPGERL